MPLDKNKMVPNAKCEFTDVSLAPFWSSLNSPTEIPLLDHTRTPRQNCLAPSCRPTILGEAQSRICISQVGERRREVENDRREVRNLGPHSDQSRSAAELWVSWSLDLRHGAKDKSARAESNCTSSALAPARTVCTSNPMKSLRRCSDGANVKVQSPPSCTPPGALHCEGRRGPQSHAD